jgi:hypothetical protein
MFFVLAMGRQQSAGEVTEKKKYFIGKIVKTIPKTVSEQENEA